MDDTFELPELTLFQHQSFQNHRQLPSLHPQQDNGWVKSACDFIEETNTSEEPPQECKEAFTAPSLPVNLKSRGLLFCHQNLNSVRNKFEEVKWFIEGYSPTIFAITESKLNSDRDLDNQFIINGYNLFRKDRLNKEGGGTLVYINENFNYEELQYNFHTPEFCELSIF